MTSVLERKGTGPLLLFFFFCVVVSLAEIAINLKVAPPAPLGTLGFVVSEAQVL